MGAKKDAYYAAFRAAGGDITKIPQKFLDEWHQEEQEEREAREDAYWNKFSDLLDQNPIGHPRLCGLPGCHGD